ncbi:MAG: hypothetical protein VX642_07195 [Bdellovibrionota bacterium]|nr:hypothetical protein [Bdellovibrionota bacterium]
MKLSPWSLKELEKECDKLQFLIGSRLQRIQFHPKKVLFLEFYKNASHSLFLDLRQPNFFLGLCQNKAFPKKPRKDLPLVLFLKSNFDGRSLKKIELASEYGRVLRFYFDDTDFLEFRLYSKDLNVLAFANGKKIFLKKPRDLEEVEDNYTPEEYRDLIQASDLWWSGFFEQGKASVKVMEAEDDEKKIAKLLKKKSKELEVLRGQIDKSDPEGWRLLGNGIFSKQETLEPKSLGKIFSKIPIGSWVEQGEFCFAEARKVETRVEGMKDRLGALVAEINQLKAGQIPGSGNSYTQKQKDLQKSTGAKTKSKNIASDLRIHIGKSAKENLILLRKAKAWYLWMHLKDVPGSHLIVEKTKNRELSDKELRLAGLELMKANKVELGEKAVIQFAECRYIRPIKGDKLGRVTVSQERTILVQSDK